MEKLQKESSAALLREAPSLHGISKMFNISCYRLGTDVWLYQSDASLSLLLSFPASSQVCPAPISTSPRVTPSGNTV
jgi:hypothetical protein